MSDDMSTSERRRAQRVPDEAIVLSAEMSITVSWRGPKLDIRDLWDNVQEAARGIAMPPGASVEVRYLCSDYAEVVGRRAATGRQET